MNRRTQPVFASFAGSSARWESLALATLAVALATAGSAAAAGGTATDQAVSLTYSSTHWSSAPGADILGTDASGDQVHQTGFWYRAQGDTREHPLPPPDSETYSNGVVVAEWNNLDGKGFWVQEATTIFDNEGPSGGWESRIAVRNDNATPQTFALFHYVDVSLAATSTGDSGVLVTPRFLKFTDGASRASYRAFSATHFQVAPSPTLINQLNDAGLNDLGDTGLPFGPGDATAAFQFGPSTLPAGATYGLAHVSAFFNGPRDHVKGDKLGLQTPTPLYAQPADLSNRCFAEMRRATQTGTGSCFGGPSANSIIVGVDDFSADFADDIVYRDAVSGVAYVGSQAISGAPTLPPNWKLSATGDFDHDGRADILWRNTTSQKLVIWTMSGGAKLGNIIPSPDQAVDANWEVAAAADFDRDGNLDLLWYNQTSGKIVLWWMNAAVVRITGQFANPATVGNNNWRVLAVGDLGKGPGGTYDTQDVVWQNDTSKKVVVWFMDLAGNRTSGAFTTPDTLFAAWDLAGPR